MEGRWAPPINPMTSHLLAQAWSQGGRSFLSISSLSLSFIFFSGFLLLLCSFFLFSLSLPFLSGRDGWEVGGPHLGPTVVSRKPTPPPYPSRSHCAPNSLGRHTLHFTRKLGGGLSHRVEPPTPTGWHYSALLPVILGSLSHCRCHSTGPAPQYLNGPSHCPSRFPAGSYALAIGNRSSATV